MINHSDFANIINLINSLSDDDFDSLMIFLMNHSPQTKVEVNKLKELITETIENKNK